ncbi:MAG: hypothetical protein WC277_10760 [Bacilli bacterium]
MRAAYEAGASIATVGRQVGVGKDRARKLLLAAGTVLRPPKGGTTGAMQTNSAERSRRVLEVLKLMLRGVDRHAIHRHGNEALGWGVDLGTINAYMIDARAELKARYADTVDELAAMADARDDYARQRALAVDDVKTFHGINTEANKRHGLYPAQKMEHGGPGGTELVIRFIDAPTGDDAGD